MDSKKHDEIDAFWDGFFRDDQIPNDKVFKKTKPNLITIVVEHQKPCRKYGHRLAVIILSGWGKEIEATQTRLINNEEMREMLLQGDECFRIDILNCFKRWANDATNGKSKPWSPILPEFLRNVWPRQKTIKTPAISSALCNLAFSNVKLFPEISEIIIPLLTTVDCNLLILPNHSNSEDVITNKYPSQMLSILDKVLPDDVRIWPYGIETIFKKISAADISLNSEERFIELKRKWNAR